MNDVPQAAPPSPLAEASPFSLEEFFSRAPWTLTEADRAKAVAFYRAARAQWDLAKAAGKTRAPKASSQTSLADLGLDEPVKP